MSAMASQTTSLRIVYSTVYSRRRLKKTSKLRVIGLCEGPSLVNSEFPAQKASNAEMFPFDDVSCSLSLTARSSTQEDRLSWDIIFMRVRDAPGPFFAKG